MEFFNFEAGDIQVLEEIEFDETIERPESIRFYTLEEQTNDAYEKLIPRGRVTNYMKQQVQREVENLKELYNQYILPTAEDYVIQPPKQIVKIDWMSPVYATNTLRSYEWSEMLLDPTLKGFYPRLMAALPKPYMPTPEGIVYPLDYPSDFLDVNGESPLRVLPVYRRAKANVHEDKTVDIERIPMEGTEDEVPIVGYFLQKRPLEIPNPLPDHPFFKSNESTFLESQAPFSEVFPTLDAVMTHGVPMTKNPYKEATPFLKLYDVRLSSIPWEQWKLKFPPADVMEGTRQDEPITFPKGAKDAPADKLVSVYKVPYSPGLASRYWLHNQLDGGELVIRLLQSESINNGSVEIIPEFLPLPEQFPEASCELVDRNFQEFMSQGTLRRIWKLKKDKDGNEFDEVKYQCVPLEFVKQERERFGYKGRTQWTEGLGDRMKTDHLRSLLSVTPIKPIQPKEAPIGKIPNRPESMLRKEIVAILFDPKRLPEDKLADIRELLKTGAFLTEQIYTDADANFLLCNHTLALLSGDLLQDRRKFYDTWTGLQDGFRVCRFCGEQIMGEDLVDQEDFNEQGFVVRHAEALETTKSFYNEELVSYTRGIQSLKNLMQPDNAVDDTMFLLLTLLQVLPDAQVFQTFVQLGRSIPIPANKSQAIKDELRGAVGLATAILLLQTHVPILVPRRSFGANPVKLNGYPRDAPTPESYSIIDALMNVFRKTFEAFPSSFKGPSAGFIRKVIANPKPLRGVVVEFLKMMIAKPDIKAALETAKVHVAGIPIVEQPASLIPVVAPPAQLNVIRSYGKCPSARPIWANSRIPKIVQEDVPLRTGIQGANHKTFLEPSLSVRQQVETVPLGEIADKLKKAKKVQIPLTDQYQTNLAIASRLFDLTSTPNSIRSVDPKQNAAELRDLSQGLVAEAAAAIPRLDDLLKKDVALYTLLESPETVRANVNRIRAQERMKYVREMSKKSDDEREVIGDLLRIGLAPYIITNEDRETIAQEAEKIQDELRRMEQVDEEVGVGLPRDDQNEELYIGGADHGDYGDNQPLPNNDGRDYDQPWFGDDARTSI